MASKGSATPAAAGAAAHVHTAVSCETHTYSDAVRAVHRTEHAARLLPFADRLSAAEQMYRAVTAVATDVEAKAAAAAAKAHDAACAVDAKFAASARAGLHSADKDATGNAAPHAYAPAVSTAELSTFRLELELGAAVPHTELPHSGDKLSSSFFAGSWRRALLRWGPPSGGAAGGTAANCVVPDITVLWPKTQAQVTAALAANYYPPISNPSGMWLLREPTATAHAEGAAAGSSTGTGSGTAKFYVVDGAYRAAYLLDPNNKPPYAVAWHVYVIENDPKFEFWVHKWNLKRSSASSTNRAPGPAAASDAAAPAPAPAK